MHFPINCINVGKNKWVHILTTSAEGKTPQWPLSLHSDHQLHPRRHPLQLQVNGIQKNSHKYVRTYVHRYVRTMCFIVKHTYTCIAITNCNYYLLMSGVCILFLACVSGSPSRILDDCLYCHGVKHSGVKSS